MTLPLLVALVVALALALAAAWHRRADLRLQRDAVVERAEMAARATDAAPLQVPVIDLAKCLGCGTCVRECPETGVLALVHGQAAVVNAAACVGHARCVSECPAGAVTLGRAAGADERADVPALDEELQAIGADGLFLVGEITARSLIRVAATQGAQVAATIAARCARAAAGDREPGVHDVVIVGAGPGGLSCALGCVQQRLDVLLVDQEHTVGGTVAKYPRQKLVLTDEVELPLHGRLPRREYAKEELVALWQRLARTHRLPFRGGVTFDHVERADDGTLVVHTDAGPLRARHVVLAVGRRGTPRRLGVPGEDQSHVTYALLDAAAYTGRHCVVVGGGDSAIETALALAEQPDNRVTIVYRQDAFFRLRSKNRQRLEQRVAAGAIDVLYRASPVAIGADHVDVVQRDAGDGANDGGGVALQLRADDVFVMAGGTPPFAALQRSGVSFDPSLRPQAPATPARAPSGLVPALATALLLAGGTLAFVAWHREYYLLPGALRAQDPLHALLRPDRSLGLWFGIAAAVAVLANLCYLARRQQWWGLRLGSLASWMNVHVATGVTALLLALLHAAMSPRATAGGWAFWSLAVLLVTGAIGRWFYAWLPRSANGRELEVDAIRRELATANGGSAFAREARAQVLALLDRRQWRSTWLGRVLTLVGLQWDLWRTTRALRRHALATGASAAEVTDALARTREAHAAAVATAHLEDLRAVLGTWRWLHRWLALLMVLLLVAHVVIAALHGAFAGAFGGGR
jgi:thioredoxin reductase/Pyruvate/2-oxoacid:ferredoxin oxidoreductase delta subunit